MDFMVVVKAVGALSFIGAIAAVMLATAAQKFHVEIDPRIQEILDALPGSNCGACGNPSCFATAEGIAEERLVVTACVAGGQEVADSIATIMGLESCAVASVVSCRHCGGGTSATRAFDYGGAQSCAAVNKLAGGSILCPNGCLGYGDCVNSCPFDAMKLDDRGLPVIDLAKCTGCGICVTECPRGTLNLLQLVPDSGPIIVRCSSHDKPAIRRHYCTRYCSACKKCEKACPEDAIHVIDWLAVVDYDKCTGCNACVDVCPQDCIDVSGRASGLNADVTDGASRTVPGLEVKVPVASAGEADGA